jgi:hypothetical protein
MALITDLHFLVGAWRGEGTTRDGAVTASVDVSARLDGALVFVHETKGEGLPVHRERIVVREHRDRLTARIRPDGGAEQEFRGEVADGVYRFVHEAKKLGRVTWEIEPQAPDAWAERFFVTVDGSPEKAVDLRHVRVPK